MDRNEKCFCGSEKKYKFCHLGIEKDSEFADIIRLYQKCDGMLAASKNPCGCGAGCDDCCHQFFIVNAPEYLYILFMISQSSIADVEKFLKKGTEQWLEIRRLYPKVADCVERGKSGEKLGNMTDRMETLFLQSQALQFPCIFLNEETHKCDVYEYRPLICRYFGMGFMKDDIGKQTVFCSKTSYGVAKNKLIDLREVQPEVLRLSIHTSKKYGVDIFETLYPISFFCFTFTNGQDDLQMKMDESARFSGEKIADRKYERFLRRLAKKR